MERQAIRGATWRGGIQPRTWARGVVTYYVHDGWGQLLSSDYSDSTPSVIFVYDAMGRQHAVADAVGVASFTYDDYGDIAGESVIGAYSKSIARHRDSFGRDLGYTLDNSRKSIIEYEEDTGRTRRIMFGGEWFTWSYLPGTDLKSSLAVGTAGVAEWTYETNRDILAQVKNTAFGDVVSQYDYVNDPLGRRTEISRSGTRMTESRSDAYGYNDRNELILATKNAEDTEYQYSYDDIGNRTTSLDLGVNRAYAANELNQYTAIDGFSPQFDLDGNQTLVKTSTGIWTVAYNGENRPLSWTCGSTNVMMKFDRMGRRVEYLETVGAATNAHHRFVYDGYLCIQRLDAANGNAVDLAFGWDPTEPVATRPLWMQRVSGTYNFFYTHDGNKNVSDMVSYQQARGVPAHYEYAPFGAVTTATTNTAFTAFNVASVNPYRFSSEYADDTLGLVYYNYRHYSPIWGMWLTRDPANTRFGFKTKRQVSSDYSCLNNNSVNTIDMLGMVAGLVSQKCCEKQGENSEANPFFKISGIMPCCPKDSQETKIENCGCVACAKATDANLALSQGGCLTGGTDGPGDALRHCIWSCMMSRRCGSFCAWLATSFHEGFNPLPWDNRMDFSNNSAGREVSGSIYDCGEGCLRKFYSGELTFFTLDPYARLPLYDEALDCIRRATN